jgi:predicted metal-dependent HD superfamily phosphohydrolase
MNYEGILENAADFVRTFMKEHQNLNLIYHALPHTESVVTAVTEITQHYKLSERDHFICMVAAWFHDIGYYEDTANHEQIGAKKAEEFLINNGVDEETRIEVKNCILATRIPQTPNNLLEEIVCDADLYHLGTDDFPARDKLMRKETEAIHHLHIDKDRWHQGTIQLMEDHHYHTRYCKDLLNKTKKQNLEKLKKKTDDEPMMNNPMETLVREYTVNGNGKCITKRILVQNLKSAVQ